MPVEVVTAPFTNEVRGGVQGTVLHGEEEGIDRAAASPQGGAGPSPRTSGDREAPCITLEKLSQLLWRKQVQMHSRILGDMKRTSVEVVGSLRTLLPFAISTEGVHS